MDFEDEFDLMDAFAEAVASGGDPFAHAQRLVPGKQGLQLEMVNEWAKRPEFVSMVETYRASKPQQSELPTKDDAVLHLWQRMQNPNEPLKEVAAAFDKLANAMGWIQKTPTVVNNFVNNKVMRIPAPMELDEFERASQLQQKSLLDVAKTRH